MQSGMQRCIVRQQGRRMLTLSQKEHDCQDTTFTQPLHMLQLELQWLILMVSVWKTQQLQTGLNTVLKQAGLYISK